MLSVAAGIKMCRPIARLTWADGSCGALPPSTRNVLSSYSCSSLVKSLAWVVRDDQASAPLLQCQPKLAAELAQC